MARMIAFTGVHVQCCANYHIMTISKSVQTGIQIKPLVKKYPCRIKISEQILNIFSKSSHI